MNQQDGTRLKRAVAVCRAKLKHDPANLQALFDLGLALTQMNQTAEGLMHLAQVVKRVPGNPQIRMTYAQALLLGKRNGDAIAHLDEALKLAPNELSVLFKLASLYRSAGRLDAAIDCFSRLVVLKPDEPSGYSNLANALTRAGRYEEAFLQYQRAIELNPKSATYQFNYGKALEEVARYDAAESAYRTAIDLQDDFVEAYWALSQLLWLKGNMEAAWQYYEKRLFRRGFERRHEVFAKPAWDGRDISGKTLLFYAEQGHGDAIQFVRYADMIAERGAKVVVECHPGLVKLFGSLKSVASVVERGQPLPPFDLQLSMMSAPVVFNTSRKSIPGRTPYLYARREDRVDLPGDPASFRVGLVWAGNPENQPADSRRSFPLATYGELLQVPGVTFYSLQVGRPAQQLADYDHGACIHDLSPRLTDFATTAAVVEQLDLVVTSCTSMPHLVGALGAEAWLILSAIPDFRWFLEGERSDWYPTLRLFRQEERGNWQPVMNEVASALRARLESWRSELEQDQLLPRVRQHSG